MSRPPAIAGILLAALLSAVPAAAREPALRTVLIGKGRTWATPAYVRDSGAPGPTVVFTAGLHGNEPASTYAALQIRHWPVVRGRIVVVPRANVAALAAFQRHTPGVDRGLGDLNRNFPRKGRREAARGVRAQALWRFVAALEPDWLVDMHEGRGFRAAGSKSVGSSIITGSSAAAQTAATFMLDAVNATIPSSKKRFVRLRQPVDGGVARAAQEHLGAHALILETTTSEPRSRRARQHRLMVHRLLLHLGMIRHGLPVDTLTDRRTHPGRTVVGLYDAAGTGGRGVPAIWRQLRRREDLVVLRVGPPEIRSGALEQLDAVVFPGGTGGGQGSALGAAGRRQLKRFVEHGGGFVGICAGAYLACGSFSWGAKILNARTASPKWRRGRATLEVELTARGRAIFETDEERVKLLYHNGPVLAPGGFATMPDYEPLAVFRTEVAENGTPRGIQRGSPAIACAGCGRGRVMVFSPHPEQTAGLGWLVERAVRWTARRARAEAPAGR